MNDTCPERLDDGGDTNHCYHNYETDEFEEALLVCCFCGLLFLANDDDPRTKTEHGPNDPAKQKVPKFKELTKTQLRVMRSLPKLKEEYAKLKEHHIRETSILLAKLKEARKK